MSLLFIDSFDHYATTEIADKGYSATLPGVGSHTIAVGLGRRAGNCLAIVGNFGGNFITQSITASDTVVVGVAISMLVFKDIDLIRLRNDAGDIVAIFRQTLAGEFEIISGGQTRTSSIAAFTPDTYSYYEVKYTKGTGSNGVFEIRKDAVVLLSITNSTETTQASSVDLGEPNSAYNSKFDDYYILNGLGATNNDYLGDVRIDAHLTDADGAITTFVPNTGAASFTHVDEQFPDDDTTFVEAGNINDRDLYSVDPASLGTVIHGTQQCVLARKTDAGVVTVDVISEKPSGTGEKINDTQTSDDDYKYHLAILELDPDDNSAWNDTKINSTEFGFKINNIVT